jgi:hypothetical protein
MKQYSTSWTQQGNKQITRWAVTVQRCNLFQADSQTIVNSPLKMEMNLLLLQMLSQYFLQPPYFPYMTNIPRYLLCMEKNEYIIKDSEKVRWGGGGAELGNADSKKKINY